jgi:hypothetical protein
MTVFASKAGFLVLGLEHIKPSSAHMSQDCFICKCPLDITACTATNSFTTPHSAVRIIACGHTHGQECLEAWLETGTSCPTCKRILFEASGNSISQADIDSVVRTLRHMVDEARIIMSIVRLVGRQEYEQALLQRTHDEEMKNVKANEAQSCQGAVMDEDDWMQSDGEEDFNLFDG